ncbi:hypothetical protein GOODEAATRI_030642 [Goodea atripinnis]|uniref:Inositol monophosphatase 1 n=1 Tax=Goodea atripinnis TaxID=208336 RepID=A0ABV0PT36_9TELE
MCRLHRSRKKFRPGFSPPTSPVQVYHTSCLLVCRFPFVAISIGFSINKRVEVGVVYSCLEDKMFTARRGKGAFCNGEPLQVSDQTGTAVFLCAILTCFCVFSVRGAGTAAINMCLVASGCVEAYYEIGIHVWDVAAGSLVVLEAGGVLMDVEGKDT